MGPESFCRIRFRNTSHAMEDIVNTIARIFDEAYANSQVPVALAKTVHSELWFAATFAGTGIWDNWFTVTEIGLGDAYAPFCTELAYDPSLRIDASATAHGRNAWLFLKSLSWLCWVFIHSFGADFRIQGFFCLPTDHQPPGLNCEAKIPQMHWKLWSGLGPLLQTCRVLRPRPRKTWIPGVSMQLGRWWTLKARERNSLRVQVFHGFPFVDSNIFWYQYTDCMLNLNATKTNSWSVDHLFRPLTPTAPVQEPSIALEEDISVMPRLAKQAALTGPILVDPGWSLHQPAMPRRGGHGALSSPLAIREWLEETRGKRRELISHDNSKWLSTQEW